MLERLLERISVSKYKDNFILKGGMLISAMLGIDSRTTMDMDTTIKGYSLTEENLKNAIISTAEHRETMDFIKEWKEVVEILENDSTMKKQWERYQKNNFYAEGIEYKDLIESLKQIGRILDNL